MKELFETVNFPVEEILAEDDGQEMYDGDVILFTGNEIELDEIVLNSFLMNAEGKYLCRESCKGICPKCGQDLNEGECSCKEDIDPRWEGLLQMMKNDPDE